MAREITTTKTVYQFIELSDEAKEKALDKLRDLNVDYEWYEFTFDYAKEIGKVLGFDIDNIYFSGFASQGDGACFTGTYRYAKDSRKLIRKNYPTETTLHEIADALFDLQKANFYTICAKITHSGHYSHEYMTDFIVTHYGGKLDGDYVQDETEDRFKKLARDFMRWIYKCLEVEYDYLTSDEAIQETIEANGYEFTEYGRLA